LRVGTTTETTGVVMGSDRLALCRAASA
jgi:hypothetical protein